MHVVMLSDLETSGGAAIAASRLAEALVQAGVRVTRIVSYPDGKEHPWATQVLRVRVLLREKVVLRALEAVSTPLAIFARKRLVCQRLQDLLMKLRPDVINVHNLHGAGWPPDLVAVCIRHAPTVWTLHDMWSFTGRCAYAYDCRKFITGCDAGCPTPTEYPALSPGLITGAWRRRKKLFAMYPSVVAVCPSRWLAQEASQGFWKNHRVEVIPNGLSLKVYRPIEKDLALRALGIETSAPVLLVTAQNLNERRKGGRILAEALQRIQTRPLTLITLGHGRIPVENDGIASCSLGFIDHERTRVLAYNAADLFVHPAPVDNLPNVVMEAIACGTPVIGFAVGGVPDMVRTGQTGWLANEVSPEALAATIDTALSDLHGGLNLQDTCRAVAEAEYSSELQAQRYVALFDSLLT